MIQKKILHFQRKTLESFEPEAQQTRNKMDKIEKRLTITHSWIIGSFIVCWTPFVVVFVIICITGDTHFFEQELLPVKLVAMVSANLNSAINPFIYAYRVREVRDTMKRVLMVERKKSSESNNVAITG